MGWIILTAMAAVLITVGVCYALYCRKTYPARHAAWQEGGLRPREQPTSYERVGWFAAIGVGVVWLFFTATLMVHTVGQREVAVVYNFSGTIRDTPAQPGTPLTWPWQHIKKENVGILHDEWEFGQGNFAVSQDQQQVSALLAVNYQIEAANVVDLYKRVGASWKTIIIDSRVPQVFKEVTSKYPTQRITAEREQLRIDTKERLTNELAPYDIHVVDVFVKNLGFSAEYTKAIEAKQKQVQDAQRAQAKVVQVKAEAEQAVARANGEAQANVARARGDALANKLRQKSLTPLLIQQQAIEKLNPSATIIFCPSASVCIPNGNVLPAGKP